MKTWKVGIVGCGGAMLCIHLPILQQLSKNFEIVALCDTDSDRLDIAAQRVQNVRAYRDIERFLQENIELVVILSHNHEDSIEKSLRSNKHVFTEKPISLDLQRSYALQKLANSRDLLLEVGLMRMYDTIAQEFFLRIPPNSVVSGILYKADGSDQLIRRSLLPQQVEPYNFHKSPSPMVPDKLNVKQLEVLKTLLWSGIHLLTVLYVNFPKIHVVSCIANDDASSIICVLKASDHQQFILNLGSTASPVYIEDIRILSAHNIGHLTFSSPYISAGNLTQASISQLNSQFVNFDNFTNYESSFFSMWTHIVSALEERKGTASLDIALRIESLAKQAAEICT